MTGAVWPRLVRAPAGWPASQRPEDPLTVTVVWAREGRMVRRIRRICFTNGYA